MLRCRRRRARRPTSRRPGEPRGPRALQPASGPARVCPPDDPRRPDRRLRARERGRSRRHEHTPGIEGRARCRGCGSPAGACGLQPDPDEHDPRCLAVGTGGELTHVAPQPDGWCAPVTGRVGAGTYAYQVRHAYGSQLEIVSTGTAGPSRAGWRRPTTPTTGSPPARTCEPAAASRGTPRLGRSSSTATRR
jgi:hypothetical protein